jgi:hypothetical protein
MTSRRKGKQERALAPLLVPVVLRMRRTNRKNNKQTKTLPAWVAQRCCNVFGESQALNIQEYIKVTYNKKLHNTGNFAVELQSRIHSGRACRVRVMDKRLSLRVSSPGEASGDWSQLGCIWYWERK